MKNNKFFLVVAVTTIFLVSCIGNDKFNLKIHSDDNKVGIDYSILSLTMDTKNISSGKLVGIGFYRTDPLGLGEIGDCIHKNSIVVSQLSSKFPTSYDVYLPGGYYHLGNVHNNNLYNNGFTLYVKNNTKIYLGIISAKYNKSGDVIFNNECLENKNSCSIPSGYSMAQISELNHPFSHSMCGIW